ncbi:MAG: squalene/phytoene synthase family protein, partial [Alphaproteobacteria bacterium]|nr:squalene/phytoene synthase family protein [Alphaproteobacteria bacterium]
MAEPLAEFVRRRDPDRFLTALFAPAEKRGALLALYAFNHELARAREVVSEPPLALIRLQWWREVVEGAQRRHEVAEPLSAALAAGALSRADLLALIDAREVEADPSIPTLEAWRGYLLGAAGGLSVAAARLLGAADPEPARPFGAIYGGAGVLRSAVMLARQGRCLLPEDVLARHGLSPEHVTASPGSALASGVLAALAADLRALRPKRVPAPLRRGALAAILPAVLARRDLRRLGTPPGPRGFGDRLAVLTAA